MYTIIYNPSILDIININIYIFFNNNILKPEHLFIIQFFLFLMNFTFYLSTLWVISLPNLWIIHLPPYSVLLILHNIVNLVLSHNLLPHLLKFSDLPNQFCFLLLLFEYLHLLFHLILLPIIDIFQMNLYLLRQILRMLQLHFYSTFMLKIYIFLIRLYPTSRILRYIHLSPHF